jgi:AcrR family transcriptional regulator
MSALRIVGGRGVADGHETDRRRRILEAATALFAEAPFDAVQVDDIARRAGVAKPTLYRYFATKELLFTEAIAAALDGLKARVGDIARGPGPADERLRALVSVMFAEIGRLKAVIVALDSSAATLGDQGRAVLRRELKHVRAEIALVVREGAEAGLFAATDPDLAARVILGGVRMAADGAGGDPARVVGDMLLGGLLARGAGTAAPGRE